MSEQWEAAFGIAGPSSVGAADPRWARAVALGARGRAAAARSVIADLVGDRRTGAAQVSLALTTRASLTRQAGRHARARVDDGAALLVLGGQDGPVGARADDPWTRAARIDALVGLAADSLGVGDFTASRRLLDRASTALAEARAVADSDGHWVLVGRPELRLAWVRTELALYTGDAAAGELSARAVALSAEAPSRRHRLKTELIAAAASGDGEHARAEAERIADECADAGLTPLEWAARTMLAGLLSHPDDTVTAIETLRADLVEWGMGFAPGPGSARADRYA